MNTSELDLTLEYCVKAVHQIKHAGIPAQPKYYELWYIYSLGRDAGLNARVNEILQSGRKMTVEDADQIYDEFIAATNAESRISTVGDHLSDELDGLSSIVTEAVEQSGGMTDSLTCFSQVLAGATDPKAIQGLVNNLVAETKAAAENSSQLGEKLSDSKAQIEDLKRELEAVRLESMTDQLTQVSNRKCFDEWMEKEVEKVRNDEGTLCLLLTDIDHFKSFNDTYGHQTGDQVLRVVARMLKKNVKGGDLVARYGGEEFAIALPNTSMDNAQIVGNKIRELIAKRELIKRSTDEKLGNVTISMGLAFALRNDTVQDLVERADHALYAAKKNGRNQVVREDDKPLMDTVNLSAA